MNFNGNVKKFVYRGVPYHKSQKTLNQISLVLPLNIHTYTHIGSQLCKPNIETYNSFCNIFLYGQPESDAACKALSCATTFFSKAQQVHFCYYSPTSTESDLVYSKIHRPVKLHKHQSSSLSESSQRVQFAGEASIKEEGKIFKTPCVFLEEI